MPLPMPPMPNMPTFGAVPAVGAKSAGLFGGGKMQTKDILGMILGTISDGLAIHGGRQPTIGPMLMQQQMGMRQQQQQAEIENQRTESIRAAGRAIGLPDAQINAQMAGFKMPEGPKPGSFEWYQGADPAQRAQYDEYNPVTAATAQGPVRVPRSRPQVGARVEGSQIFGPTR